MSIKLTLRLPLVLLTFMLLLCGCDEAEVATGRGAPGASLQALVVEPSSLALARGTAGSLKAVGYYQDGTAIDLTDEVEWKTPEERRISLSPSGGVLANAPGQAQVRAVLDDLSAQASVSVTQAELVKLQIEEPETAPTAQQPATYRLVGLFSDGSQQEVTEQASFRIEDGRIAEATAGSVTARAAGQTTLTGSFGGMRAQSLISFQRARTLTSIRVTPSNVSFPRGVAQNFTATGVYSDGSTSNLTQIVSWRSSNSTIVSAAGAGASTGIKAGSATISAVYGGRTGTARATVNSATLSSLSLTSAGSLPAGTGKQLSVSARYSNSVTYDITNQASFRSLNPSVASVVTSGATRGYLSALRTGSSVISATFGGRSVQTTAIVSAPTLTALTIAPATVQLPKGLSQQLAITARYSDNSTRDVTSSSTFSSSNSSVATVSTLTPRGVITARNNGSATITASFSGRSASSRVSVVNATLSSLRFEPATTTIAAGTSQRFLVRAIFSDSSQQDVTSNTLFSLTNSTAAEFTSLRGEVRGLSAGSSRVNASYGGKTANATVNVTPAVLTRIEVTPAAASFPKGTRQQFAASGVYSDGRTQNLTSAVEWTAADPSIVELGQGGEGDGARVGETSLSASYGGKIGTARASVTAAVVTRLSLSPEAMRLPAGLAQQLKVTAHLSDATSLDVTDQASYLPSNGNVSVSNSGELLAGPAGASTVTVGFDSVRATLSVTVLDALLQTLTVTPQEVSLPKGLTRQYAATGLYSDGTSRDVSSSVLWTSETPATAEIDISGLAVTLAPGQSLIKATLDGKQASSTLTVRQAEQTALRLAPDTASLSAGQNLQLAAYALFTDGTEVNVTNATGFTSSDPDLASVVAGGTSRGLVRGRQAGSLTVEGRYNSFVGQTAFDVLTLASEAWPGLDGNRAYSSGEYISNVAAGDFDGDGDLDIAASDPGEDRVAILFNDGAGDYVLAARHLVGNQPGRIVAADLDGDGDLDLALSEVQAKAFRTLFNDGRGSFSLGASLPLTNSPQDLALADIDSDGDLDVAIALYDFDLFWEPVEVPILLNDGAGRYSTGPIFDSLVSVRNVRWGDVDADGDCDLVVADDMGYLKLFRNDGAGEFSDESLVDVDSQLHVQSVDLADMDEDGDVDLVVQAYGSDSESGTIVCLNDGAGSFHASREPALGWTSSQVLGDLDGDGDIDLITCKNYDSGLRLLFNNGKAKFDKFTTVALSGVPELALADVDGDGFSDILAAGSGMYSVTVLKNDGQAGFFEPASASVGNSPITMTSGDFDGDGRPDLVTANRGDNTLSMITNPADGPRAVSTTDLNCWPASLRSGDLNGDGLRDLILIDRPNSDISNVIVLFNQGQARFAPPVRFPAGKFALGLNLGDIDGDGDLDLAVANQNDYDISVFRNNGAGVFGDRVDLGLRYWPNDVHFGDADGDGDLDLVTGANSSTYATLFFNDGSGAFGVGKAINMLHSQPRSVTFADLDGDGDNDLISRDYMGNRVGVLTSDGAGNYTKPTFFPTSPRPNDFQVTDIDQDGHLDIVLACGSDTVSVLRGDGAGKFVTPINFHAGGGVQNLAVEDFDLDGDLDVATNLTREHRVVFLTNKTR